MGQQIINVGAFPNDGTGDPVRLAMQKANAMFTELYGGDYFVPRNNPHVYGTLTVSNMLGGDTWTLSPGDPGSQSISMVASGPDNDINLNFIPKGSGGNNFYSNGALQASITGPAGATRYISMAGSVAGNPVIQALGGGSIRIPDLVMTGNPTAPTPPLGDNDTSVATSAFVVAYAAANVGLLAADNLWTGKNFFNGTNTVIGHTAVADASIGGKLQVNGLDGTSSMALINWGTGAGGFGYTSNRSKSGTVGVHAAVVDADSLGQCTFRGSDGAAFVTGAFISAIVEGAVASNQVPGKMIFSTRPAGGPGLVQRLLIDSLGRVVVGPSATSSMGGYLNLAGALTANATFAIEGYQAGASGAAIALRHSRGPAVGQLTSLQVNDYLGIITFEGVDSVPSMTSNGASIQVNVDAGPGVNHIPARITFWTDNATNYAERARITNGGSLQIFNGGAAPPATLGGSLGIAATTGGLCSINMEDYQAGAGSPVLSMKHSRGAYGAQGALLAGDPLAQFSGSGSDGTGFVAGAGISFFCDSAPATGHMPSRISFNTENGASFAERVRIYPSGGLVLDPLIVDPGQGVGAARIWQVRQTVDNSTHGFQVWNTAGDIIARMYVNANKHLEVYNNGTTNGFQVFSGGDDVNPVASFLPAGVSIKGTNTNDAAAVGFVGENRVSNVTSGTIPNGSALVVTSLASLPAGDYEITGAIVAAAGGAAQTIIMSLSTSAALDLTNDRWAQLSAPASSIVTLTAQARFSLASATTINLLCQGGAAGGTVSCGTIRARRMR